MLLLLLLVQRVHLENHGPEFGGTGGNTSFPPGKPALTRGKRKTTRSGRAGLPGGLSEKARYPVSLPPSISKWWAEAGEGDASGQGT